MLSITYSRAFETAAGITLVECRGWYTELFGNYNLFNKSVLKMFIELLKLLMYLSKRKTLMKHL
jgi:hypothetical protein